MINFPATLFSTKPTYKSCSVIISVIPSVGLIIFDRPRDMNSYKNHLKSHPVTLSLCMHEILTVRSEDIVKSAEAKNLPT